MHLVIIFEELEKSFVIRRSVLFTTHSFDKFI